jgi:hypothetical protein
MRSAVQATTNFLVSAVRKAIGLLPAGIATITAACSLLHQNLLAIGPLQQSHKCVGRLSASHPPDGTERH